MLIKLKKKNQCLAQSALEYTVVVAAVLAIVSAMSPMIQRSSQAYIKLVADQVGIQNLADQQFNEETQGYLRGTVSSTRSYSDKKTQEVFSMLYYTPTANVVTDSVSDIDLGKVPNPH